jgi:hypothetical protein
LHILQQWVLTEKEANHVWHMAVDRLIVGDAGAWCIGDRDVASTVRRHQARHSKN